MESHLFQGDASVVADSHVEIQEQGRLASETVLMDLPNSLLIDVLCRVSDAVDLAAILSACRQFRDIVATIPWTLKLDSQEKRIKDRYTYHGVWHRAALAMVRRRMPFTWKLDLSGCAVLDEDVASSLGCLRNLESLILDSCQKLTSSVVDALAVSVRSGPRAASLQRCFRIGPAAAGNLLAAAAADGSRLQCILLSHLDRLDLPRESPYLEEEEEEAANYVHGFDKAPRHVQGCGLRILALHNCGGLGTVELATVGATCPLVELLLLGGSVEGLGLSRVESLSTERVVVATTAIVDLVLSLQRLQILELTFFAGSVIHAIREELVHINIWDFYEKDSLTAALSFLRHGVCKLDNWEGIRDNVALALRAAANCSDMRRRTPLHWAAAQGEPDSASCLVKLGAATAGMDSSGASPIFVAAESGHSSVCKALLEGGADAFAKNRAGENPVYIAALKGHCDAVEVMLSFCALRGWNWQDVSLYGDGWTPLMAAAVADRQDVGRVLLLAIGYSFNSNNTHGSGRSSKLLDAQNRHGQTAMHIAARRASVWFVTNLLAAGASVDIPDEYGDRALDVAINYGHRSVIEILRQWDTRHGSSIVTSARTSSRRKSSPAAAPSAAGVRSNPKKIWRAKTASGSGSS